jgi:hypothetical protein
VADNWKYIRSPQPELYDLATDSLESQNRIAGRPDRLEQMEQQLFEMEDAFELHEGADVSLTSQERQALESHCAQPSPTYRQHPQRPQKGDGLAWLSEQTTLESASLCRSNRVIDGKKKT